MFPYDLNLGGYQIGAAVTDSEVLWGVYGFFLGGGDSYSFQYPD
jgi:hypothetical protein